MGLSNVLLKNGHAPTTTIAQTPEAAVEVAPTSLWRLASAEAAELAGAVAVAPDCLRRRARAEAVASPVAVALTRDAPEAAVPVAPACPWPPACVEAR